jgi:hypothetical protein
LSQNRARSSHSSDTKLSLLRSRGPAPAAIATQAMFFYRPQGERNRAWHGGRSRHVETDLPVDSGTAVSRVGYLAGKSDFESRTGSGNTASPDEIAWVAPLTCGALACAGAALR